MIEVLPTGGAELLDRELLGHRPLVLGRVVVRAAAVSTRHFDDVAHCLSAPEIRPFLNAGARNVQERGLVSTAHAAEPRSAARTAGRTRHIPRIARCAKGFRLGRWQ